MVYCLVTSQPMTKCFDTEESTVTSSLTPFLSQNLPSQHGITSTYKCLFHVKVLLLYMVWSTNLISRILYTYSARKLGSRYLELLTLQENKRVKQYVDFAIKSVPHCVYLRKAHNGQTEQSYTLVYLRRQ